MSKSQYETYEAYGPRAAPPGEPGGALPGLCDPVTAVHTRAGEPLLPRQGTGGPPGREPASTAGTAAPGTPGARCGPPRGRRGR
ncbi:hypothetical protein ACFQ3Z_20165 [Streptomyces nogalater]